jgi:hypothetical protein
MKTVCQTSKSSIIKKAKASNFNKPDKRPADAAPAVPIPSYIFTLGRTLSHTEMRVVQRMSRNGSIKEDMIPTADDFAVFTKLLQRTTYSHKDELTERVTITHINVQAVTAIDDDFILSSAEKKLVCKVNTWLALVTANSCSMGC